ncbi:MAG: Asp-tRNA(Asn)/Glu-tRNA(Gln) amidotransferase subunit GatC [Methermicoccaceae archaeon]
MYGLSGDVKLITQKDMEHIGWLCRLSLTDEEKSIFTGQLNTVLEYFNQLDEVDTGDVEPTYHVVHAHNVFREDAAEPSLSQEEVLSNAPRAERGYFRAPRIM